MKLVRFGPPGQEKPGLIDADGRVRDLSGIVADIGGPTLSHASLAALRRHDPGSLPLAPADARLGPCVGNVGNFVAVGLNYADHAAETDLPIPAEPILFNKAPSCIVGPNDDGRDPEGLDQDRLGGRARHRHRRDARSYVAENEALDHVAGYCVCNDVSEREFQVERGGQWMKGKGCPTFGPLGPWLVTPRRDPGRRRTSPCGSTSTAGACRPARPRR